MNNEFKKDIAKAIKNNSNIKQELTPGSTDRRYEPNSGLKKHREKIHRDSKFADNNKSLPFSFRKPIKPKKSKLIKCSNCGNISNANTNTVGIICSNCNKFSAVEEVIDV
jgi:formylmethanofuran dehydrogenase subunit E